MPKTLVGRWESRSGKHWLELFKDELGFTYRGDDRGGNLGSIDESQAIAVMTDYAAQNTPVLHRVDTLPVTVED